MQRVVQYDVAQMQRDMAAKGWLSVHLADYAGVSKPTVSRFFDGRFQTAPIALKLAKALGYSLKRYQFPIEQRPAKPRALKKTA